MKYLTVREASKVAKLPYQTLYNLIRHDKIPGVVRIGCHYMVPENFRVVDDKPRITIRYCPTCGDSFPVQGAGKKRRYCKPECRPQYRTSGGRTYHHKDEEVLAKYMELGTLQKTADFYGVTRERIRQRILRIEPDYLRLKPEAHPELYRWCQWCGEKIQGAGVRSKKNFCNMKCRSEFFRNREEKRCPRCKKMKPIAEFGANMYRNGRPYQSICKKCKTDRNRQLYRDRRDGLIPTIREGDGKVCTKCKEWHPWSDFRDNFVNKDAKSSLCVDCEKPLQRLWQSISCGRKKLQDQDRRDAL